MQYCKWFVVGSRPQLVVALAVVGVAVVFVAVVVALVVAVAAAAAGLNMVQLNGQVTLLADINGRGVARRQPYDELQRMADGAPQCSVDLEPHKHLFGPQHASPDNGASLSGGGGGDERPIGELHAGNAGWPNPYVDRPKQLVGAHLCNDDFRSDNGDCDDWLSRCCHEKCGASCGGHYCWYCHCPDDHDCGYDCGYSRRH